MPLIIDHASRAWLGREEDKSRTMIDVLEEVKGWLGVETKLKFGVPRGGLFRLLTS